MEPVEFLRLIRRRWAVVAAFVVVGLIAGWVTSPGGSSESQVESFTATATLAASSATAANKAAATSEVPSLDAMAFMATTGEVPRRAAAKLGFDGPPALLASRVRADANDKLNTIAVRVSDVDGPRATDTANAFATELIGYLDEQVASKRAATLGLLNDRQRQLNDRLGPLDAAVAAEPQESAARTQRDAVVRESAEVFTKIAEINAKGPAVAGVTVLQEAVAVPDEFGSAVLPRSPVPRMIVTALIGLVIAIGGLVLLDRFDTRVRTKQDAEAAFGFPVLAEVPTLRRRGRKSDVLFAPGTGASFADAYRLLRASLILRPAEAKAGSISDRTGNGSSRSDAPVPSLPLEDWKGVVLVTSPGAGEGKSTSAAGLSASFAEIGKSVLVLSWDFHNPAIHHYLGAEEAPGLSDALATTNGKMRLRDVVRPTAVRAIAIVTTGTRTDDPTLLGRSHALLGEARHLADVVIVDTPPILLGSDALDLLPAVDAVVLVSRVGRTRAESAQRAGELLARFAAPVHGIVLVGTEPRRYPKGYRHYRPVP